MTPHQIELVRTSFATLAPHAVPLAKSFYEELFRLDPALRALFKGDMEDQGKKLMQVLGVAVSALSRLEAIVPTLRSMGRRHAGYGVREYDFETVGTALLTVLRHRLGEAFDEATQDAWAAAYALLKREMRMGMVPGDTVPDDMATRPAGV